MEWNKQRTSGVLLLEVEARLRGSCALPVINAIRSAGVDSVVDWCGALCSTTPVVLAQCTRVALGWLQLAHPATLDSASARLSISVVVSWGRNGVGVDSVQGSWLAMARGASVRVWVL